MVLRNIVDRLSAVTPKHPLPMRTTFRGCFRVNFAMSPESLARVLPHPLQPELYCGQAFVSAVIADMERMRPAFMPSALGVTYQLVVYRAVVRYGDERGVYFLRSDADNHLMVLMGNLLSIFQFHRARIVRTGGASLRYFDLVADPTEHADIHATFDLSSTVAVPPASSVFPGIDAAREFLVELDTAFCPESDGRCMNTVRIEPGHWVVKWVHAPRARFDFMNGSTTFPAGSTRLDSVIYVEDVEYHWHTLERRAPYG